MFERFPHFFGYLRGQQDAFAERLTSGSSREFSQLLLEYPVIVGPLGGLGAEYARYLREIIRYGISDRALNFFFRNYFSRNDLAWAKGSAQVASLDTTLRKGRLSDREFLAIRSGQVNAHAVALYLNSDMVNGGVFADELILPGSDWNDLAGVAAAAGAVHAGGAPHDFPVPHVIGQELPPVHERFEGQAPRAGETSALAVEGWTVSPATTAPGIPDEGTRAGGAGGASPERGRDFVVTAHVPLAEVDNGSRAGDAVESIHSYSDYVLRLGVGRASVRNLAAGDVSVRDVPPGGMATTWIVKARDVDFLPSLSNCRIERQGALWLARFDLFIPGKGDSDFKELGIRTSGALGEIQVTIFATRPNSDQMDHYRELTLDLATPGDVQDEICTAAAHTLLHGTHEWTTPEVHVQVQFWRGSALITMLRGAGIRDFSANEEWPITTAELAGPIQNVRTALEALREEWSDYFNAIDAADAEARLPSQKGLTYAGGPKGWQLPDLADKAHRDKFDEVLQSEEWHKLAWAGYALYDACFPKPSAVRAMLDELLPGSRVDFVWTEKAGAGRVPHVPWALMCRSEPDVTRTKPTDPEAFLGLRLRIGMQAWSTRNGSRALIGAQPTQAMNLLYWGSMAADDVGVEARWQSQEFKKWGKVVLPDRLSPDSPKKQALRAIDRPVPAPVGVVYLYCHCSGENDSSISLRFGDSLKPQDVLSNTDLSFQALPDAPLVFANACSTAQADPFMTGVLEGIFFGRGVRAFVGTETRVPVQLASKFAWIFFQFFYRRFDADPMSAGEALVQTRMFLWTQYRNVGGLFYSMVNQYDLFFASHEEVVALRQ